MNVMQSDIQWFIARDGKQHGPISDAEMMKLVELRHLRPIDLVWRHGFAEWRPAPSVFPEIVSAPASAPAAPVPSVAQPQTSASSYQQDHAGSQASGSQIAPNWTPTSATTAAPARTFELAPAPRRGKRTMLVAGLLLLIAGGGAGVAYYYKDTLEELTRSKTVTAEQPAVEKPTEAPPVEAPKAESVPVPAISPIPGLEEGQLAALDGELAKRPHLLVIRRDFPEWYAERVREVSKLQADSKQDGEIGRYLAGEIVKLRRQNMQQALSAPLPALKEVAAAFLDNLESLEKSGAQLCYSYIARGENNPLIAEMLHEVGIGPTVKTQVVAVFNAISEGRKSPVKHASAQKPDYDILAGILTKNGWTTEQLQLFANPSALSQSAPEAVCKMVQDWFKAHLAVEDAQVQERLLFETLKPVVGG